MKAIVLTAAGAADNLLLQEMPMPNPAEGEVLVKTTAISINPVDIKTRKGGAFYASMIEPGPAILGWDIAGEVEAVGHGVTAFKKGDRVFGMVNFPGHGRAYAEYVVAPAAHLANIPANVTDESAAAATLAALTAWQVLTQQAGVHTGQHVLVHAGAGGVGHFAVQMARHLGASVSATASEANAAFLNDLGARTVIDYTRDDFSEKLSGIDVVLDPIGGDTTRKSLQVMKPGGTLVSIVGGAKEAVQEAAKEKGITAKNYLVHSSGEDMATIASLLERGQLKPMVSHRFSFDQMPEAHRQIETSKTRGKIVAIPG